MKNSKKSIRKSKTKASSLSSLVIHKDIVIQFQKFTQVVENCNISDCINDHQQLCLKKLFKKLQKACNFFFKNQTIRFYLHEGDIWMRCPRINYNLDADDYMPFPQLRFQMKIDSDLISVVMNQNEVSEQSEEDQVDQDDFQNEGKCRRLKQRRIKNVIEKVLKWRELYAGIKNGVETEQKISLDDGADIVKISKKTLDDYLAQLKKGRKYGFNFNEHKNDKVGILREFIRKAQRRNLK